MSRLKLPPPKILRRQINEKREQEALSAGLDPIIARIVAGRPFLEECSPQELLSPRLKMLDPPQTLADIDKAVARLMQALENQEIIGIETDHDCDGQTSHAVLYTALTAFFAHPPERIRSYIGHRLKEGYGLSPAVTKRILADELRPSLIITADNGSSDEAQIAQLKQAGIDVIVTDHHEIPVTGIPKSAVAVINPTREDCKFPDRYIAGCMVAWLVMAALRQKWMEIKKQELPSLGACLDFVAVGTIADCVSIARSRNNRAVVAYGLKLIQQATRPCWQALKPLLSSPVTSEDLGFKIGPLLNSDGRLACAFGSVSFLLAQDAQEAAKWIEHLQTQNAERKQIQEKITTKALEQALAQFQEGKITLSLFLEDGHAGVHGICASRIKDFFGRPVIQFCPREEDPTVLTGSGRSIEGVHLRQILQEIHDQDPSLMHRFGGHQGAAGLTLRREKWQDFSHCFEKIVRQKISPANIGPVILSDGELPVEKITLPFLGSIFQQLEPFGREFEPPIFEIEGMVLSVKPMGQTQTHARIGLAVEELWFEAVWFNCCEEGQPLPVAQGEQVKLAFSPRFQIFRGERQLSCQVVHMEKICRRK